MPTPRAIVVGAGGISGAWFPLLVAEKIRVQAVVDLNTANAEGKIAHYGLDAEASGDLAAMLEKYHPDFVVDLTVPESHCAVTCAALRAGCHVIGEKPMAASMAEARKMVKASEESGQLYMVSQSRRWEGHHEQVARVVRGGKLGDLTLFNCDFYIGAHFGGFRDEMPSPLILDMSIHHFDLARYMTGADPVSVYCREFNPKGSWYKGDVAASAIFEMTDGIIFTYRGSWCAEGCPTSWNGDWRFTGVQGSLVCDHDQTPRGQVVASDTGFSRKLKDVKVPAPRLKNFSMHGALREMLAFLRTGKQPQTECHDNIKSLAMVFAAIESNKKGKRVDIKAL
jgi:predicted dehydrogenase